MFRPIEPGDKWRLQEGLKMMSPESRYKRFFRSISSFSDADLGFLTEVDHENHEAWVALLAEDQSHPGIGVIRWVRIAGEPDVAEGAVTVIDEFQGQGVGKALLLIGVRTAIENEVRALRVWVMGENHPVLGLMRHGNVVLGPWESGVAAATIALPASIEELSSSPLAALFRSSAIGELEGFVRHPALTQTHVSSTGVPK
ncbi:MAG TPA: GNAT family N-acetyltransferase [Actinomycetota bacterium]|nr:GNAT family N-acetyltransferase [Actinomycetota bacterium]